VSTGRNRLSKFQFHLGCRFAPERIFPPAVYERAHRRYAEREIMEYRSLTALASFLPHRLEKPVSVLLDHRTKCVTPLRTVVRVMT
jgi:hypothetical protein